MVTKINSYDARCPSCGCEHTVEDTDPEDYDDLCPACEEEWVNSLEYQLTLGGLA